MKGDQNKSHEDETQEQQVEPELTPSQKRMKEFKQLLKSPIQLFFLLCGLVALIGIGPFTYYCYKYTEKAIENKPEDYVFPDWRDFKWVLLSVMTIGVIDVIAYNICLRCFRPICKEQDDLQQRERRSKKAAYNIFKVFYFLGVSIWGYYILLDKRFFPKLLGGSGDIYLCHKGFPYQDPKHRWGIQAFLLGQLGYHVQCTIRMYVFQEKTRDIVEMTLHEVLTIYLYGGCYLTQFWEVGALVSLVHGVSDVLLMLSKVLSETKYGNLTAIIFVLSMLVWLYMRLIVFPWISWFAATQDIDMGSWLILPFFGYGLFCLVVMHAYWFNMFVQILLHFIRKGEAEDKIEEDLDKQKEKGNATTTDNKPIDTENQLDEENKSKSPINIDDEEEAANDQDLTYNLQGNFSQSPIVQTSETNHEAEILSESDMHVPEIQGHSVRPHQSRYFSEGQQYKSNQVV